MTDDYVNGWHREVALRRFLARLPERAGFFDCWPMSTRRADGYATFGSGLLGGELYVHRIAWVLTRGPLDPELELDHLCHTRNCVNPLHLDQVTHATNTSPARRKPVTYTTHCAKGHEMSGPNLYVNPKTGARHCRECMRIANLAAHHAKREQRNAERRERRRRTGR